MTERDAVIHGLMELLVEAEGRMGRPVEWEKHLPQGKAKYTAREVCNAIGAALTEAGVENNLFQEAFHDHLKTQGTNPGGPGLNGLTLAMPEDEA